MSGVPDFTEGLIYLQGVKVRFEPHVLTVISGYEFSAMVAHSSRLPTITVLWKRLPDPIRRILRPVLVAALAVWAWFHFD